MASIIPFLEYLSIIFGIYLLVSIGLNIEVGYAGIPDFGKALSFGIGMLAVYPIFYKFLGPASTNPVTSIMMLIAILVVSFLIGFLVGFVVTVPAVRLREDYLAMYLLGVAVIVIWILHYNVFVCPATGNYFITIPNLFAWAGSAVDKAWALTVIIVAIATLLICQKLCSSPFGRILKAIRENEMVVETYGRNVILFKLIAMGIGSGITAMAGALYVLWQSCVSIGVNAQLYWTFIPWLIILLGGLGNLYGTLIGSFIFALLDCTLRTYLNTFTLPFGIPVSHVLLWIGFGVTMLIILIFRPEGVIPEKPIFTKPIRKLKALKKQKESQKQ